MSHSVVLQQKQKCAISIQLLRYCFVCLLVSIGPLALGWTTEFKRPLLWLAAVLCYRLIEESGFQADRNKGKRHAEWLFFALYVGLSGSVVFPAVEFAISSRPFSLAWTILGITAVAIGTMFRYLGVKTLGKHFSTHVEVRDDHVLIDSGVYRYIRHPAYAGVIFFSLGSALILQSFYSLLFTAFVFWPLIGIRIVIEEQELSRELRHYADYMKRSKRLVPYVF